MIKLNLDLYEETSLVDMVGKVVVLNDNNYYLISSMEINEMQGNLSFNGEVLEINVMYELQKVEKEVIIIEDTEPTNRFDLMEL